MQPEEAFAALHSTILQLAGPPPKMVWTEFCLGMRIRSLDKSEFFANAGTNPGTVAFVASGLFRMFYLRSDGRELNKSFVTSHDFIGCFEALLSGDQNQLFIECLIPAVLLEFDYSFANSLYEHHVYWQRFGRLLAERLYVKKARREAGLLMDNALQRYESFLAEYAKLEKRIPDYHIASYLGITPEALSRLKKTRGRS